MSGEFYRTCCSTVTLNRNRWVSDGTGWLLLRRDGCGSDNHERWGESSADRGCDIVSKSVASYRADTVSGGRIGFYG